VGGAIRQPCRTKCPHCAPALSGYASREATLIEWLNGGRTRDRTLDLSRVSEAPRYMIRDRDRIYGTVVTRRLRAMGIRDKPITPASPWQNGFAERLIGSIGRECVHHIIVLGEAHLRRILKCYAHYYNGVRTHRSLNKDAPVSRSVQRAGVIRSCAILGGLHRHYSRI
jgi:Integrase core domain